MSKSVGGVSRWEKAWGDEWKTGAGTSFQLEVE